MERSILTVPIRRVEDQSSSQVQDLLAIEEPLEIRIGVANSCEATKTISLTMRTPGHDFELAAGFLFTEGILAGFHQIHKIRRSETHSNPRQAGNSVTVELNPDVEVDFERLQRHFYTTSSCGVCGKASIEATRDAGLPGSASGFPDLRFHGNPSPARNSSPRASCVRTHRRIARCSAL